MGNKAIIFYLIVDARLIIFGIVLYNMLMIRGIGLHARAMKEE